MPRQSKTPKSRELCWTGFGVKINDEGLDEILPDEWTIVHLRDAIFLARKPPNEIEVRALTYEPSKKHFHFEVTKSHSILALERLVFRIADQSFAKFFRQLDVQRSSELVKAKCLEDVNENAKQNEEPEKKKVRTKFDDDTDQVASRYVENSSKNTPIKDQDDSEDENTPRPKAKETKSNYEEADRHKSVTKAQPASGSKNANSGEKSKVLQLPTTSFNILAEAAGTLSLSKSPAIRNGAHAQISQHLFKLRHELAYSYGDCIFGASSTACVERVINGVLKALVANQTHVGVQDVSVKLPPSFELREFIRHREFTKLIRVSFPSPLPLKIFGLCPEWPLVLPDRMTPNPFVLGVDLNRASARPEILEKVSTTQDRYKASMGEMGLTPPYPHHNGVGPGIIRLDLITDDWVENNPLWKDTGRGIFEGKQAPRTRTEFIGLMQLLCTMMVAPKEAIDTTLSTFPNRARKLRQKLEGEGATIGDYVSCFLHGKIGAEVLMIWHLLEYTIDHRHSGGDFNSKSFFCYRLVSAVKESCKNRLLQSKTERFQYARDKDANGRIAALHEQIDQDMMFSFALPGDSQ